MRKECVLVVIGVLDGGEGQRMVEQENLCRELAGLAIARKGMWVIC